MFFHGRVYHGLISCSLDRHEWEGKRRCTHQMENCCYRSSLIVCRFADSSHRGCGRFHPVQKEISKQPENKFVRRKNPRIWGSTEDSKHL